MVCAPAGRLVAQLQRVARPRGETGCVSMRRESVTDCCETGVLTHLLIT